MTVPSFQINRATDAPTQDCLCCGRRMDDRERLVVDLGLNIVVVDGVSYSLSAGNAELLAALLQASPRALTRDQLLNSLYGAVDNAPGGRSIDTHIKHLRRQFHGSRIEIVAYRGIGYGVRIAPREPTEIQKERLQAERAVSASAEAAAWLSLHNPV